MDSRQEKILKSCGVPNEKIEQIKKRGFNCKEETFLNVAIKMLDYLEEKYNEKFEVVSGGLPGIFNKNYWIRVHANNGKYAYENFNTYLRGENGCSDEYFNILMRKSVSEYFTNLVKNEGLKNIKAFATLSYDYGKEYTTQMSVEEVALKCSFTINIVCYDTEISLENFNIAANRIERKLIDNGINFDGDIRCLSEDIKDVNNLKELCLIIKKYNNYNKIVRFSKDINSNNC